MLRSQALNRADSVWPYASVPYSQSRMHSPDGYRADCSGFVSMCWGIPTNAPGSWGGLNTVNLVTDGWMHEIKTDDLQPADAIGRCGPGTQGDGGHIQLFAGWRNGNPADNSHYVIEQAGGGSGPRRRLVLSWVGGYRAYRFRSIASDFYPLSYPPHYFGDVAGPDESHGGYWQGERGSVRTLQRALIRQGWVNGVSNPLSDWADGVWESATTQALRAFQRAHRLPDTGRCEPATWRRLLGS